MKANFRLQFTVVSVLFVLLFQNLSAQCELGIYPNASGLGSAITFAICDNGQELFLVGNPAGGSYLDSDGGEISSTIEPSQLGAGTHQFFYSMGDGQCIETSFVEIISPLEPALLGPMDSIFCNNDAPVQIVSSSENNPPSTSILIYGSLVNILDPSLLQPGIHHLVMQHYESNGCATNDSLSIQILEPAELSFNSIPDTVCLSSGPFEGIFGNPQGGTLEGPGVSGSTFDPSSLVAGVYNYSYFYVDSLGACPVSLEFDIVVEDCAVGIEELSELKLAISQTGPSAWMINNPEPFTIDLQVFSSDGSKVFSELITEGDNLLQVDLAVGMYWMRFASEGRSLVQAIFAY